MSDNLVPARLTRAQFLKSISLAAVGLTVGGIARSARAEEVTILETGSSLLYPLFNLWVGGYQKIVPGIRVTTQSTGSGTGIAQAVAGIAQIGASDAYMANPQVKKHPDMLNIPLAISAQNVVYNLPGLNDRNLKLSGPVLAGIYSGKITSWDDAAIAALNPGITLPKHVILPIHRTDGSGDTFIFTQYLSFSTPEWASTSAYGTTVSWPAVQGGIGAIGNPGMVQTTQQNPYSLSYIGVSFAAQVQAAGLGVAALQNKAGQFVLPNPATVGAAAAGLIDKTPADQRISLIFADGDMAYPIINYEYAIVNKMQPSAAMAKAIKGLLTWAIDPNGGSAMDYLGRVHFIPLLDKIRAESHARIATISS
ncbi:phosphate ABC transporter substrate-binding protein PstS [Acidisoma cladoniae]|jgi:phosphate transport system substrate-binding protein|uniref:phosphate ABC transporter substrate-binding protein PstS n=1 Tax=Acidisoma cladoniae TaxID=3040935 RepID=UPI00254E581A|nr:phosphate ABC transporter substrate-binding protein PstS [Acidisoma sp. PAMC 29798]